MAEKCSIFPHCTNSKGEVVESRLFKDLLHYTSNNRELAKEYYGKGIDPKFLELVQDSAKFDENGEITFQSLRKLAKLNVKKDILLNMKSTLSRRGPDEDGYYIDKNVALAHKRLIVIDPERWKTAYG